MSSTPINTPQRHQFNGTQRPATAVDPFIRGDINVCDKNFSSREYLPTREVPTRTTRDIDTAQCKISIAIMKSDRRVSCQCRGFTLIELMVVVAIIGILAALVLSTVAKAKTQAHGAQCLSNLRQLQTGWTLFISDHDDALPPNSDGWDAGRDAQHPSWVAGNLRPTHLVGDKSDNTNAHLLVGRELAEFGSIGGYVENPNVYRCPGDKSGRVRSMSMNSYLNGTSLWHHAEFVVFTRFSQIPKPADIWVFLDEREESINEGSFAVEMAQQYAIIDYPANYHDGSGNLSFADGHVERHRWLEATTTPALRPGYPLPPDRKSTSSNDRDMMWLTTRTTIPK